MSWLFSCKTNSLLLCLLLQKSQLFCTKMSTLVQTDMIVRPDTVHGYNYLIFSPTKQINWAKLCQTMKERHSQPKQITQETSKIKQNQKNQLQNKIYLPWLLMTDKKNYWDVWIVVCMCVVIMYVIFKWCFIYLCRLLKCTVKA